MQPNFFIVGAPKCGTTAMQSYLSQHPDIFMPSRKELHFFGTDFTSPAYVRDPAEYLGHFSEATGVARIGEASVYYLYSKVAAEEIKAYCPDAKIIIMLRSPAEMLYSYHSQLLSNGFETLRSFPDALAAERDRRAGNRIPRGLKVSSSHLFYRDLPKYTEQVARYFDAFGRDQVHIILFDDFRSETPRMFRETLSFLGVAEGFAPQFKVVNPNTKTLLPSLRRFIHYPDNGSRRIVKALIPFSSARKRLKDFLLSTNTRSVPRDPLDHDLQLTLRREFSAEVQQLGKLIDRNLGEWQSA